MRNKILYVLFFLIFNNLILFNVESSEQFNFDVTEIEILENGNIIKGLKKGTVTANDGIKILADTFIYNKISSILTANGNVEIIDDNRNLKIYSENAVYKKNEELLTTSINSKAIYEAGKSIFADKFIFDRSENIINAIGKVRINDPINDYLISGDDFTYYKNFEKIVARGDADAIIKSNFKIASKDMTYFIKESILTSKKETKIENQKNSQVYFIEKFKYLMNTEILKGNEILIITNYNLPKSDTFFLKSAIIDLKNNKFIAKNTEIEIHKSVFDNTENDPRLKGVSSSSNNEITIVNKGFFTSCKKNDNCPPWSIKAESITHNKLKKKLTYNNAILNIYDIPVLYFPKFFHPDPSVERQSGLLKPIINNSNILGSSLTMPYFKVISGDKDFTFKPTWFDNKILMTQNEFRKIDNNYDLLADFSFVKGYKSSTTNKKKNLSHLFVNSKYNLELENFIESDLIFSIEKVNSDTYLKVFDAHITKSEAKPKNLDSLNNHLKLILNHEKFTFESGIEVNQNLQISEKNDKYQHILPYYNMNTILSENFYNGSINFSSSGSNTLKNTNNLETNIINDLNFYSQDFISNLGFKKSFNINIKNLNSLGKKSSNYKSTPQVEIVGLLNAEASLPLYKSEGNYDSYLTPKVSFKFNPSDMKNYASSNNKIDVGNIFAINRLGLSDTYEAGKSLTLGIDYKKENLNEINEYFTIKLAAALRDKEENFIPTKSTLNRKTSNLFGSITKNMSNNVEFNYNFAIDNDFNKFEYNDFNATFSVNNLITKFNFIEENGEMGDTNSLESKFSYQFNNENILSFNTRRNRKLNLTEYYDLVYEYKNDCLTAGVKYKKTYYQDRDLKPTENLLFTVTLFPLTVYEYDAKDLVNK